MKRKRIHWQHEKDRVIGSMNDRDRFVVVKATDGKWIAWTRRGNVMSRVMSLHATPRPLEWSSFISAGAYLEGRFT